MEPLERLDISVTEDTEEDLKIIEEIETQTLYDRT